MPASMRRGGGGPLPPADTLAPMADTEAIRPRSRSERRALLVGYGMAVEMARHAGPEAARRELEELTKSEERLGPRMPATCRHEWVMGDDACVNCGESWLGLYPEEVLAPMERRGLNRLLAVFPKATIYHAGRPPSMMNRLAGDDMETPWTWCDLIPEFGAEVRRFVIWKTTGDVYELDEHGAVGDEPVIKLYAEARQ